MLGNTLGPVGGNRDDRPARGPRGAAVEPFLNAVAGTRVVDLAVLAETANRSLRIFLMTHALEIAPFDPGRPTF
jgi:hypothetical protein